MSAYICSPEHVSFLATYYTKHNGYLPGAEPGKVLALANIKSVETRYPDEKGISTETFQDMSQPRYVRLCCEPNELEHLTPVEVIKHAQCFAYQACEASDWEASDAKKIIDRVIDAAIGKLPGYTAAGWGF